jgi:hypothetical protein
MMDLPDKLPIFSVNFVCASMIVQCTSCFESDKNVQIAPCSETGNPLCSRTDVNLAKSAVWMGALPFDTCNGLRNLSGDVYSNVQCCGTDECNFQDLTTPSPPPGAPPPLPGNGPCERPNLTWEVRSRMCYVHASLE